MAEAIQAFGGVDVLVALDLVESSTIKSVTEVMQRQRLGGALVGVRSGDRTTLPDHGAVDGIRRNDVAIAADADPALVAEALAFLASSRSSATSGAALPVG